jgi:hypothetical protein
MVMESFSAKVWATLVTVPLSAVNLISDTKSSASNWLFPLARLLARLTSFTVDEVSVDLSLSA